MTAMTIPPPTPGQRAAAARWLVRLDRGDLDAGECRRLKTWLDADPRHRQALNEAQALWQGLEAPARRLAAHPSGRVGAGIRRWWHPPRIGVAGVVAVLVLMLLAPLLGDAAAWVDDLRADQVAPRGQVRVVDLPDGSVMTLAGNSAATLAFAGDQRRVSLLRGEAFFQVRPDPARPFVVVAGDAWARVVGTGFDVWRGPDRVVVTVDHGTVDVGADGGGSQRLTAGQAVDVVDGRPGAVVAANPVQVAAWRDGRMVFFRQPVAAVAAALRAQSVGTIVIANPGLAGRRISGSFPADDVAGTLAAIGDTLGARVVRLGPFLTVVY